MSDKILEEETKHIIKDVNEYAIKKVSYNTSLIITCIVGLLVSYMFGYTAYVFLFQRAEAKPSIDITLYNEAKEYVKSVPYVMDSRGTYDKFVTFSYYKLDKSFLIKYAFSALSTSEYMKVTECEEGRVCTNVRGDILRSKLLAYYNNSNVELPLNLSISKYGNCVLENGTYKCVFDPLYYDNYTGRISEVEYVKFDENIMYIYEYVLFVENLNIEKKDNKYVANFNYLSSEPDSGKAFVNNGSVIINSDNKEELLKVYANKSALYMHTYSKQGDKYTWQTSKFLKELPE